MDYIKTFESCLREHGKAKKTMQSYTGDVAGFITYLREKELEFEGALNRFTIHSYKNHLLKENYEPTTINKKINSLQSFNLFLIDSGTMKEKVIDLGRDRIKIAKGSEKAVEVFGKGGKYREIPLKVEVVESIKKYLLERRQNKFYQLQYLLLGQRGAIQRDAINRILVRITKEAKLPQKLKPHTFRHTFCTNLIGKGVPLTTVSKLAGHSSIETTSRFYVGCS